MEKLKAEREVILKRGGSDMKGDLLERIITRTSIFENAKKTNVDNSIYEYQYKESRRLI